MSLDAAHHAFEAGDFFEARRLAKELKATASDEPTRLAADELLKRTGHDPLIVWLTVACGAVFAFIVIVTLAH
jgi:hypothetical protein